MRTNDEFKCKCPVCKKKQLVIYGIDQGYSAPIYVYKNARCPVCGFEYKEEENDIKDPTIVYDRLCYTYEKAQQRMIGALDNLKSAFKPKSESVLEDILAELKEIKHILLTQNTRVERFIDPDDRVDEIYEKNSDLLTTPPGFKAPDITCSVTGANCFTCLYYNDTVGQCERGVAGCKYEPDERGKY